MTSSSDRELIDYLLEQGENETVEFKGKAPGCHDTSKYVSALANEARLHKKEYGWLVIGIEDKAHEVVGTGYKKGKGELEAELNTIRQKTGNAQVDCREVEVQGKRVIIYEIAAAIGIPVLVTAMHTDAANQFSGPLLSQKLTRFVSCQGNSNGAVDSARKPPSAI